MGQHAGQIAMTVAMGQDAFVLTGIMKGFGMMPTVKIRPIFGMQSSLVVGRCRPFVARRRIQAMTGRSQDTQTTAAAGGGVSRRRHGHNNFNGGEDDE